MWFKGLLFLSYTALIITPTSADLHGQGDVAYSEEREALGPKPIHFRHRRQAWSNQTRTSTEVTSQAPPSPTSLPVVVTSEDESSDSPTSVTPIVVSSTPLNEVEPPTTSSEGAPRPSRTPSEVRPPPVSTPNSEVPSSSGAGAPRPSRTPSDVRPPPVSTSNSEELSTSEVRPPTLSTSDLGGRSTSGFVSSIRTSDLPDFVTLPSLPALPSVTLVVSILPTSSNEAEESSFTGTPVVESPSSASEIDQTSQQESRPTFTRIPPTSTPQAPSSTSDEEGQLSTGLPEESSPFPIPQNSSSAFQSSSDAETPSQTSALPLPSSQISDEPEATPTTIDDETPLPPSTRSRPTGGSESTTIEASRTPSLFESLFPSSVATDIETQVPTTVSSGTQASRTPSFFESLFPSISSGGIPFSESSGLQTENPATSDLASPTSGISLPGASGTGLESAPTDLPSSTDSGNVPVSESLDGSTQIPATFDPAPSTSGVSFPGASGTGSEVTATDAATSSSPVADVLDTPTASLEPGTSGVETTLPTESFSGSSLLDPESTLTGTLTGTQATPIPTIDLSDVTRSSTTGQGSALSTDGLSSLMPTATASQGSGIPTSESTLGASATPTDGLSSLVPTSGAGISGAATGSSSAQASLPSGDPTSLLHTSGSDLSASTDLPVVTSSAVNDDATTELPTGTQRPGASTVDAPETSSDVETPSPTPDSDAALDPEPSSTPSSTRPDDRPDDQSATTDGSTNPTDVFPLSAGDPLSGTPTTLKSGYIGVPSSPSAAATTTEAAGGAGNGPPPPLSKSQTAGIAIGGTTCLLIALVAALFIARRYHHQRVAKRKSAGGVYPEVAYLYDPAVGRGNDDAEAGGAVPAMSGGATGYDAVPRNSPIIPSAAARPSSVPSLNPFRDPIIPSPQPSPRPNEHGASLNKMPHSVYGDIPITPHSPNVFSDYPVMSPYDRSSLTLPDGAGGPSDQSSDRSSDRYSDPFSDPFDHEVLLDVDTRTETPDSIVVLAPPPTPRGTYNHGRYSPAITHGSETSLSHPTSRYTQWPDHSSMRSCPHGKPTPETAAISARLPSTETSSLSSGLTNSSLSNSPLPTPPPRAASPPVIRKGWDDIKYDDSMVPAPLSVNEQVQRKPVSKRQEPALAGAGQLLLSGQGLPLTVKPSGFNRKNSKGLGLEVLPMGTVYGGKLGPVGEERSPDHRVVEKRSAELLFARESLVGKNF